MARSSSVSLRNGRDCQFECRGCADGLYCRQKHSRKWRRIGIEYDRDRLEAGHNFAQQLNPLCPHAGFFGPEAGYVAAGTGQTLHEALGHWQRTRWGWCWSPVARRPTTAPNWPRGCRVASRPAPWRAPAPGSHLRRANDIRFRRRDRVTISSPRRSAAMPQPAFALLDHWRLGPSAHRSAASADERPSHRRAAERGYHSEPTHSGDSIISALQTSGAEYPGQQSFAHECLSSARL